MVHNAFSSAGSDQGNYFFAFLKALHILFLELSILVTILTASINYQSFLTASQILNSSAGLVFI